MELNFVSCVWGGGGRSRLPACVRRRFVCPSGGVSRRSRLRAESNISAPLSRVPVMAQVLDYKNESQRRKREYAAMWNFTRCALVFRWCDSALLRLADVKVIYRRVADPEELRL